MMIRTIWRRLIAWVPARWSRRRYERDLHDELQAHLDFEADDLIADGLPPAAARARAQRVFGHRVWVVKEEARDAWGWGAWDRLAQDLRAAARQLRRHPGFTIVAAGSLALGIGANTAIFSLVDAVAFRALPLPQPDRLVSLVRSGTNNRSSSANVALYETVRARNEVFSHVALVATDVYKVRGDDAAAAAWGQAVTGSYHDTLGVRPLIGRLLTPQDDAAPQPAAVVVLGHAFWRRQFDANPAVLGRTLVVNGQPHTIVGVTPPEFFGLERGLTIDVTVPMARPAESDRETWRGTPIVARLKPGVSVERATADVDAIFQPFMETTAMSASTRAAGWQHLAAQPLAYGLDSIRRELLGPLTVLGGIVLLVLLLACANLAGLLIARGVTRQRELAIRAALGAGRWRIARMLLIESLALAALGAAAGLLLAWAGTATLLAAMPADGIAPLTLDVRPNLRLLGFTIAMTLATALFIGVAPTLQVTRRRQQPALTGRSRAATPARQGAARAMVVVQVALALVLVISAALLVRSLHNLRGVDAGFSRPGIVLFSLDLAGADYDYPRLLRLDADIRARLEQLPGVDRVTTATITPLSGADETRAIELPGLAPAAGGDGIGAHFNHVGAGYFDIFGIPVLRGRAIEASDLAPASPDVALVSQRFARQFFGEADPIGRTVSTRFVAPRTFTIVGLARDVRQDDLRTDPVPLIYVPLSKRASPPRQLRFAMRSAAPAATMPEVRRIVRDASPDLPVLGLRTMEQEVDQRLVRERLLATLGALFGIVALLLAALGVYGLLAYAVSRRTNEIGLRLALGATRARVVWLVCRESLVLAAAGIVIGLVAAAWTARLLGHVLERLLFGLTPTDLATVGAGVLLLLGVALAAGALPARRAARVDPLAALRHE